MKKKFFAIYALVGALVASPVFTSCVDDEESASVTALRDAKAEQLKAAAALANAQAQAETILANAEAAYKAAEAAYKQAQADAMAADAAHQAEMTKQAQEKYAIQLDVIKAQAERDLLSAQIQIENYEKQLLNKANEELRSLYEQYAWAVENTTYYQTRKIDLTNQIAKAEAGLLTSEESAALSIARYEDEIAYQELLISLYEKYDGADIEALDKAKADAQFAYNKAQDTVRIKKVARDDAKVAYENARFVREYYDWGYSNHDILSMWSLDEVGEKALALVEGARIVGNYNWNALNEEEKELSEALGLTYTYYSLNEDIAAATTMDLENNVEWREEVIGKAAEGETEATGLYKDLADAEKAKADALTADPNADVSSYDDQITRINADIQQWSIWLADDKEKLAEFKAAVASFEGEGKAAYDKFITDLTALVAAYDKAEAEYQAAMKARAEADAAYQAAYNLAYQNDAKAQIRSCESTILMYQEWIQGSKNGISDKEAQIAQLKVELANVEAELAARQAIVDTLKAQIDAMLAEGDTTTEETPAE